MSYLDGVAEYGTTSGCFSDMVEMCESEIFVSGNPVKVLRIG